jgi:predicted metal-dependent enzyme (double-stranded beta helix superfamily)
MTARLLRSKTLQGRSSLITLVLPVDQNESSLSDFISLMKEVTAHGGGADEIMGRLREPALRLASSRSWIDRRCSEGLELGRNLVHEEPDHSLAILLVKWRAGSRAPAHDHGTWTLIAGIEGEEINTLWRRKDDGSRAGFAEIEELSQVAVGPGRVLCIGERDIHTVSTPSPTLAVHIYGMNTTAIERNIFDPVGKRVSTLSIFSAG